MYRYLKQTTGAHAGNADQLPCKVLIVGRMSDELQCYPPSRLIPTLDRANSPALSMVAASCVCLSQLSEWQFHHTHTVTEAGSADRLIVST